MPLLLLVFHARRRLCHYIPFGDPLFPFLVFCIFLPYLIMGDNFHFSFFSLSRDEIPALFRSLFCHTTWNLPSLSTWNPPPSFLLYFCPVKRHEIPHLSFFIFLSFLPYPYYGRTYFLLYCFPRWLLDIPRKFEDLYKLQRLGLRERYGTI